MMPHPWTTKYAVVAVPTAVGLGALGPFGAVVAFFVAVVLVAVLL